MTRVLMLSWEYPPVVEGGLARHVRKLSEQLVRDGHSVQVLTRGRVALEERRGVTVQRVREPGFPRDDLDAFIAWVARMNADMVAAAPADGCLELVHSHDWLVADAARALARRFEVPWLVTVHATEYGRHAGRVAEHPQAHIHAAERRMARDADRVIACSSYMRGHLREALGVRSERIVVIPNGVDPSDMSPAGDLARVRARFAAPGERLVLLVGRLVYEKGFHVALAALPRLIERAGPLRFVVADTGGLREVVPGRSRVGLRFRASDPRSLARMAERLLGDDALRARLVAEASEHVLRFDWADAARRTAALYAELRAARSSPVTTAPAGTSPRTTA